MKKVCIVLPLIVLVQSCGGGKADQNTITNNLDDLSLWLEHPALIKSQAHSGEWCSITDSLRPYSITLRMPFSRISSDKPKKLNGKAWVMSPVKAADAKLVLSLEDGENKLAWNGSPTAGLLQEPGTWYEVTVEINIPENVSLSSVIKLFGWSDKGQTLYWDDFSLTPEK